MAARWLAFLGRYPLVGFVILSYGLAWAGWWLEYEQGSQFGTWLGYFGPALAALLVAGKTGIEDLLARLLRWRLGLRWVGAACLLPWGLALAAVAVSRLIDPPGAPDVGAGLGGRLALVAVFGTAYGVIITAGEEIGWRGFLLPRLLTRYNALVASLIVGIVWGLWHLPLGFVLEGPSMGALDILLYGLGFNFAAVIYTWLYQHTRGSLVIACLFHSAYDVAALTGGQLSGPGSSFFRLLMLALGITAAILVLTQRADFLRRGEA